MYDSFNYYRYVPAGKELGNWGTGELGNWGTGELGNWGN